MASPTKNIQAVATINHKDLLFYVTDYGAISFFESQSPKEADMKAYKDKNIQVDGETVLANEESSLITAVAYRDPATSKEEVRVFYVEKGTRKIRELTRTDGGEWMNGNNFNGIGGVVANKDPSLTANVAFNQLKVYYHSRDHPRHKISMIYTILGSGDWKERNEIDETG